MKGDERIRTAVCDGTNDSSYVAALNHSHPSPDWAWEVLGTWDALVEATAALPGLLEIAEMAMPDSYFQSDSRVAAARAALAALASPEART